MKFIKTFFILWASLLIAAGCAVKEPMRSASYLVVFKTPKWRFADTGYVRTSQDTAQLEVFTAGQPILKLTITDDVCVENEGCVFKHDFNVNYLSAYYPDDLLKHLLQGKPIFDGKNLISTQEGFSQKITSDHFDITYTVDAKQRRFKDRIKNILIKFKRLP